MCLIEVMSACGVGAGVGAGGWVGVPLSPVMPLQPERTRINAIEAKSERARKNLTENLQPDYPLKSDVGAKAGVGPEQLRNNGKNAPRANQSGTQHGPPTLVAEDQAAWCTDSTDSRNKAELGRRWVSLMM